MNVVVSKTKLLLAVFLGFLVSGVACSNETKLSPPWYLLQQKLNATLGADPCVQVDQLTGEDLDMTIKITVCNDKKADALASFANKRYEFGDLLAVTVTVYNSNMVPAQAQNPADLEATAKLLSRALSGNKYFVKVGMGNKPMGGLAAYVIFKPLVIQYFSDDLGDWYQNTNEVASKLFSDVLNLHPYEPGAVNVFATTAPFRN